MHGTLLVVLLFCGVLAQAIEPDLAAYQPGKLITPDRHAELSNQFFNQWQKGLPFEAAMQKANDEVEPEALLAALNILSSEESQITYASFDPIVITPEGEERKGHDSLQGFRVVRRRFVKVGEKNRLLSSIHIYDWDEKLKKMVPVGGVDSFRVRVQVDDFVPSSDSKAARGFVGFSWKTEVEKGDVAKVIAQNNVTDDKKRWLKGGHQGSYDANGGPCSWTTHCNVCHHASNLTAVSNFGTKPLKKKGTLAFLGHLEKDRHFSKEQLAEVSAVLADPKTAFPADALKKALLARWHEANQKK